ncbi:MAG TPA: TolC family protein [Vicinamibacterales bacterium]|nr:TolC family protein [Vicinamibacterales bacterium]
MRARLLTISSWALAAGVTMSAQTLPTPSTPSMGAAPTTLRLTVDDAVKMALDHNVDLAVDRLDPQISDTAVAAANGAFKPTFSTSFQRNNQLQPPSSFLIPTATRNDAVTSNVGLSQQLPWFGTSYSVAFNAIHTDSNSFLNSYNPLVQSGLSLSVSQPLLRNVAIDNARQQVATSKVDRDIAGTRLRESLVHTAANVKSAYWNLVSALANVESRQSTLDSAKELVRVNKAKVDVGNLPPLDLVSAEAEVASDEEQLIIAETAVKQLEDQLRTLIFDTSDRTMWTVKIDPADTPPTGQVTPDLDLAVTNALRDRADLARAHKDIDNSQLSVKFTNNQRLPDVRLNAGYVANGLGGTQVLRDGGFPGTIVGPGGVTGFGSVLNQLFSNQYPTWTVGVSISHPIGQAVEEANYSRAKLEHAQAEARLRSAETRAVQQVRDAWWKIEMNAKRIETARAARELADQRLDSERKRFDVGMSTSFLVIQAQRDLAQSKSNELAAILAYDLALVDFDALQQAGPATTTAPAIVQQAPSTTSSQN